jgi:hypothetical protein
MIQRQLTTQWSLSLMGTKPVGVCSFAAYRHENNDISEGEM